jgi:5'-3' exonuclease
MSRLQDLVFDTNGLTAAELESFGDGLAEYQRSVNWWIGDAARYAKHVLKLGDNYSQVFPPWMSPGLIQRCEAVASAYPRAEDRNPAASWTQHMQVASKPDRIALVARMVGNGLTSDESRQELKAERQTRWLLAVDVNYFLHRFWFSGAGVESAHGVATWIRRTADRLREKGLTDVACCFDSKTNHRKQLTSEWTDKYKDRPPKDAELVHQLQLVHDLLYEYGFACVTIEGHEADDVMASFAKQFPGRVTLLTQDKDCRQCLSDKCNMLLDVEWTEDETSGEMLPDYKWLSAKTHTEKTGIPPSQWIELQMVMGDATDGIKGAKGIGEAGAKALITTFGTVAAAIQAAKDGDERLRSMKRGSLMAKSLLDFEAKAEVTRQLVSLKTDLKLDVSTRI